MNYGDSLLNANNVTLFHVPIGANVDRQEAGCVQGSSAFSAFSKLSP